LSNIGFCVRVCRFLNVLVGDVKCDVHVQARVSCTGVCGVNSLGSVDEVLNGAMPTAELAFMGRCPLPGLAWFLLKSHI
jgi:hypothetical protein